MANQHYYVKVGQRPTFRQENIIKEVITDNVSNLTVYSRRPYKPGVFIDPRAILVGDVRLPSQFTSITISLQTPNSTPQFANVLSSAPPVVPMPRMPPYPYEIATKEINSDSGWAFWHLRFGPVPTLNTSNQNNPTTEIPVLSDSGIGIDPASNLGKFSKVGGWGWRPDQYERRYQPVFNAVGPVEATGFIEQRQENPAQAASHPGYNNLQCFIPSALVNQRMRGIFTDFPAKIVAGNIATENDIAYYGNAPGQIPSSPAGIPTAFPEILVA